MPITKEKKNYSAITMPMVALRGLVAFPNIQIHFEAGRKHTIFSLNAAADTDGLLFLTAQKDVRVENPKIGDVYETGCVAKIKQVMKGTDNSLTVVAEGLYRAQLVNMKDSGKMLIASAMRIEDTPARQSGSYKEAMLRKIKQEFARYISLLPLPLPKEKLYNADEYDDIGTLCDFIAANILAPIDDRQYVLEQLNPVTRGKILLKTLSKECDLLAIDNKISSSVKHQMDENQREYYLREQIKAINEELYGEETGEDEEYYAKISELDAPDEVKTKLLSEVTKLVKMPQGSQEASVYRNYLDTCLSLPYGKFTKINTDLKKSAKILDRDFYGMKKVKERILEMLSVYCLAPDIKGQIICLVGPPGVGKTSIAKTIAECVGRKFSRIALGGISDEAEIRGHRRTYIGAMPGKIISALKQAGSSNPLILLDEIDKLGRDYKGDPAAALLEVLDGEQNISFTDHYIDMPYDLSKVLFITTANDLSGIPAALADRLEIIELSSYTREEKFNIAKSHLLKRQLKRHGLTASNCKISDSALYGLIDFYTREAGVRQLERLIASLCRKSAKQIVDGSTASVKITAKNLEEFLGHKKFKIDEIGKKAEVGVINGLAWTAVGGEIMQIEVSAVPGSGKLELTGSLGDVMKESAHAAVTYVRSRAEKLGIQSDFYKSNDIHIHATEAAIPKDGPSAGVTMTTALVSALTNRPIRHDIALTGEITIRGRVLPIGGLKEKSMAAYRGGVKQVFIPYDNIADLDEVDETVKNSIEFIPVHYEDEILDKALI